MPIHFKDSGNGVPVVFLHGFPLDSGMWASNAEFIRSQGFRTILPDFPGFGRSNGHMSGISETAGLVYELLDSLKIHEAVVCGLSMGGYVALEMVRSGADRIAAAIFCDTTPSEDSELKRKERYAMIENINKTGAEAEMVKLASALISSSTISDRPQIAKSIISRFKGANDSSVCAALKAMALRSDSNDLLDRIEFPVKLIYGADDVMLPAGIKMNSAIRTSTLDVIPDAGHFPNLELPVQFDNILSSFLKETFR